jgi:hypothetical protein
MKSPDSSRLRPGKESLRLLLSPGHILRVECRAYLVITCHRGSAWITTSLDTRDYLCGVKESVNLGKANGPNNGVAYIEALVEGTVLEVRRLN